MSSQDLTASPVGKEPDKTDEEEEEEEEEISPLTGEAMKKHEKWGLRGLTKDQHNEYWAQARYWCFERFVEAKWRAVVARIERAAKEDNFIVFGWHPPQQPTHVDTDTDTEGKQVPHIPWSFTSSTGAHPLRPLHLERIATSSPTTPRPRWDIVTPGPPTPLSPTSGPLKNAFAEGGVWASLSPKTPASVASISSLPTTAVPDEVWTPDPPRDAESKAAYDEVQKEVRRMTLQVCADRLALRRSSDGDHDVIHPSMVKPKDELAAFGAILESLKDEVYRHLDITLPARLEQFADDEATCLRKCTIDSAEKLEDVKSWLWINETTGEITNILEAQRDLLRMNRDRRKSRDFTFSDGAVQCAWAAKILNDTEYILSSRAGGDDTDSEDDDDEGYNYENFLRSLRSTSSSTLGDTSTYGSVYSEYSSRGTESGKPDNNLSPDTQQQQQQPLNPFFPPSSSAFPSNPNPPTTTTGYSYTSPHSTTSPLSPEQRFSRRKAPSQQDLDNWADELKRMERKRTEMILDGTLPRLARYNTEKSYLAFLAQGGLGFGGAKRDSEASSATSSASWRCETASLIEDVRSRAAELDGADASGDEAVTPRLGACDGRALSWLEPCEYLGGSAFVSGTGGLERQREGRGESRVGSLGGGVSVPSEDEQDEWARELERMEKKEKTRQAERHM